MSLNSTTANRLITNINLLKLTLYFEIIDGIMYTIFQNFQEFQKYIIFTTPHVGTYEDAILVPPTVISWYSVNYNSSGTLILTSIDPNVVLAPFTVIRSIVQMSWRSRLYDFTFQIPNVSQYVQIKESILNLFCFPSPNAYVLFGSIVIIPVYVDSFFTPLFIGILDSETATVKSLMTWDWGNGTLVGLIQSQIVYYWNNRRFAVVNQYPNLYDYLDYTVTPGQDFITGGKNSYLVEKRTTEILVRGTYATNLSKQADILVGDLIRYKQLNEFVVVPQLPYAQYFILSFSNYTRRTSFPCIATLGYSNFRNTDYPLLTFPAIVDFVEEKDDTFTEAGQFGAKLYFKYDDNTQILTVYYPTFDEYMAEQTGDVVLSDLRPYSLNDETTFNDRTNELSPQMLDDRYELAGVSPMQRHPYFSNDEPTVGARSRGLSALTSVARKIRVETIYSLLTRRLKDMIFR